MKVWFALFSFLLNVNLSGQNRISLDSITNILETVYKADQEPRLLLDSLNKRHSYNSPEVQQLVARMERQDSINKMTVTAVIDKYGWLGAKETSDKANRALFLVIQHADLSTQLKYLPLLKTAVEAKKANPDQYALLLDRTNLKQGRFQVYGSQLSSNGDGVLYFDPIIDEPNVNKRRSALGLESIEEYAKRFGLDYKLPAHDTLKNKAVLVVRLFSNGQPVNAAAIYLNNEYLGQTDQKGFFKQAIDKSFLNHKLIFKKEGHITTSHSFDGAAKEIFEITLALQTE